MINIRKANLNDAESLLDFVADLDSQSDYLLYGQGERINDMNRTIRYLKSIDSNKKSVVFIAENEQGNLMGFLCGETSHINRISHVMKVNIGILKKYRRTPISRMLGHALFEHINNVGIIRVEATVVKSNKLSLNLCKKFGLEIEGIKRCSIKIGDMLHDEYLLSKLLI